MSQYKISKKRLAEIIKEEYQSLQHRKTRRLNEDANDDTFEMLDSLTAKMGHQRVLEELVQAMERSNAQELLNYVAKMNGINDDEVEDYDPSAFNRKDEKMDPVGKEDGDVDNDGDEDSSDEYLKNRREKVGKAIKKESLRSIRNLIQQELKNL